MITIRKLRHLIAVNNYGSFSKAAVHEHVSQSALSRSISDIERVLDQPLFHRTTSGAVATEAGQQIVARATRVLADMDALLHDLSAQGRNHRQRLRILVAPAAVEGLLGRTIGAFSIAHPEVTLEVIPSPIKDVGSILLRGDADIAIGVRTLFSPWNDLTVLPLVRHRFVLFVRDQHPLTRIQEVSPADLLRFPIVLPPHAQFYSPWLKTIADRLSITTMNHFPTIQRIVRDTDHVSIVFDKYTGSRSFRQHFRVLENLDLEIDGDLYYARIARHPLTSVGKALIALARDS